MIVSTVVKASPPTEYLWRSPRSLKYVVLIFLKCSAKASRVYLSHSLARFWDGTIGSARWWRGFYGFMIENVKSESHSSWQRQHKIQSSSWRWFVSDSSFMSSVKTINLLYANIVLPFSWNLFRAARAKRNNKKFFIQIHQILLNISGFVIEILSSAI